MRALLIDDEIRSVENLAGLIRNYCAGVEILGFCHSVDEAYEKINDLKPDLIFLDVSMPPQTGFDLLKRYEELPFEVIFVTAFDHYSIDAIKFSALYYLLKPVKIDDLRDAIKKAELRIQRNIRMNTNSFHAIEDKLFDIKRVVINSNKGSDIVDFDDILYIEANNSYSTFHLKNDKKILSTKNIKEYEQMLLNKGFFRIHKSYIVNVNFVLSIDKKEGDTIILKNSQQLPLAIRRKEAFLKQL
jgi:two-component system LytT family response regulator